MSPSGTRPSLAPCQLARQIARPMATPPSGSGERRYRLAPRTPAIRGGEGAGDSRAPAGPPRRAGCQAPWRARPASEQTGLQRLDAVRRHEMVMDPQAHRTRPLQPRTRQRQPGAGVRREAALKRVVPRDLGEQFTLDAFELDTSGGIGASLSAADVL